MLRRKLWVIIPLICLFIFPLSQALAESSEDFVPLLIDIPGWEGDEPETMDMTQGNMVMVTASRDYDKDNKHFTATVYIGTQAASMWNPTYAEGFKLSTNDVVAEVKKINGFLVYHSYEKDSDSGGCIVLLNKKSQQPNASAIFFVDYDGMTDNEAIKLAKNFDWTKMQKIAQNF
ncbi:MAG: hypothetical protein ACOC6P_00130 [Candidatus Aminicenantaceae bacterium]